MQLGPHDLVCTNLKPVDGASDVPESQQETVAGEQVGERSLDLPAPLVAPVDGLEGVSPECQRLRRHGAGESQATDHAAPEVVHDEVRSRDGAGPSLVEGQELSFGVPAALLSGLGRFVVHGGAQGQKTQDL